MHFDNVVLCKPLNKSVLEKVNVGNHFVYTYGNVSFFSCSEIINSLQNNKNAFDKPQLCVFRDLNGNFFNKQSPLSHPHLLFNIPNKFNNYDILIQMSKNNKYCGYLLSEFTIKGERRNQYASYNFSIFNNNDINKFCLSEYYAVDFLKFHNLNINNFANNLLNEY